MSYSAAEIEELVDNEDEALIAKAQKDLFRRWEHADKLAKDLRRDFDWICDDNVTATVAYSPQHDARVVTFEEEHSEKRVLVQIQR